MILEQGNIYHIYNQGNNRQKIFFNRENYLFFLKKLSKHILPYADVLAWCLMPNHFHLMVALSDRVNLSSSHPVTINNSIAIMLRSYTRAINIQQARTGSLFREGTKAVWLGSIEGEKMKSQNRNALGTEVAQNLDEEQLKTCFRYIHENPVKTGLAYQIIDWEFSSAIEIAGIRKGLLVNKKLINELGLCLEK